MTKLSYEFVRELTEHEPSPCVSIYQPTHRHSAGIEKDRLIFRKLLGDAEKALHLGFPAFNTSHLVDELKSFANNLAFWNHQLDGLALFIAEDFVRTVQLRAPFSPKVVVADSFHIKPLLSVCGAHDRYYVLALSQSRVQLYEGTRYGLFDIPLQNVPQSLNEFLRNERNTSGIDEPSRSDKGRNGERSVGGISPSNHSGHGDRAIESDKELVRYIRAVDRALTEHYFRGDHRPVIVAALPEHFAILKKVSRNRKIVYHPIPVHPDGMSVERLTFEAWKVFEPIYQSRITQAIERFKVASMRGTGSAELDAVAKAAVDGRIDTIIVEAEKHISGSLTDSGDIQHEAPGQLRLAQEDILDHVAERVLATGGRVYVLPHDQMPTQSGVAATFRY